MEFIQPQLNPILPIPSDSSTEESSLISFTLSQTRWQCWAVLVEPGLLRKAVRAEFCDFLEMAKGFMWYN
jgi:hypothetical protein